MPNQSVSALGEVHAWDSSVSLVSPEGNQGHGLEVCFTILPKVWFTGVTRIFTSPSPNYNGTFTAY